MLQSCLAYEMFSSRVESPCRHGERGTSVCLYCRQEARDAARRRRNRLLTRFGLTTLGGAAVIALIVGALVTLAPASRQAADANADATIAAPAVAVTQPGAATPSLLTPQIPIGLKELGDGMKAERTGDEVTVTFDTDSLRTRYDWKFEGVVRATLPLVFGEPARAALDSIEPGMLLAGTNLIGELPRRGLRIQLHGGLGTIRLWPVVRTGRDGPLVSAYRAAVTR